MIQTRLDGSSYEEERAEIVVVGLQSGVSLRANDSGPGGHIIPDEFYDVQRQGNSYRKPLIYSSFDYDTCLLPTVSMRNQKVFLDVNCTILR
ncbi:hypothetical protein ARMSODRAFT_560747 [Armillaria solidipes]|uniref:Uncharacterized protein n=1 Tax=Armillaria solidipes TaxID=1076256 RepID=A0A2H3BG01_9AGAR|nr:hypothetical protein ARMSODRAFT_560747 [Armillaria solidipes]